MSSNNKIHPVYAALDANQYSRAIKLCLAMPKDNTLAQALLAHAYNKSMQRYKAILVIQQILGTEGFQELQLECKYSKEAYDRQQEAASAPRPKPGAVAASKKGKKGKMKPAAAPISAANKESAISADHWTLAEHIQNPPRIDENWEKLPPVDSAITDDTTLATLVITLQNLKLFLTSYQLYCWAASKVGSELFLRKAYLHGLGVLVTPQYCNSIAKDILANMQVLALQLAKIHQQQSPGAASRIFTSWVAQTALWQLKLMETKSGSFGKEEEQEKEMQRRMLLPRLAENLASKCIGAPVEGELASAQREVYFLYLRTLEYQNKWREMLDLLQSSVFKASEETGVSLAPKQQVLQKKAECLQKLERYEEAKLVFEELLNDYPDNYTNWKGHLACSLAAHGNEDGGYSSTEKYVHRILEHAKGDKYPKRGPHLMLVELMTARINQQRANGKVVAIETVDNAINAIMHYGEAFSVQVSCAFTDLQPHVYTTLQHCSNKQVLQIIQWLQKMRDLKVTEDPKELRGQHRTYIFSVKMTHVILNKQPDLMDAWLPDWKDLVRTWKKTHLIDSPVQKECLPGDDLILLAIQQILRNEPTVDDFFLAAVLVEAGMKASSSNATLKIAALDIYSKLNAASRSWAIYQELQIKHIQLDTCTYLILPVLQRGGYYQEILKVAKGLLMLHTSAVRETGEFMGRAMDNGILSKADEFMFFQREKMTNSLTALEATGLMMDSAPFFAHDVKDATIGRAHGIVGEEADFDRATEMVVEVRNPYGALSLLERTLSEKNFDGISDNRDLSILLYEVLYRREVDTREDILNDSIRRGHTHNLLIRSALCVHYTKGPKKGKLVKPGAELSECSKVLLLAIESAAGYCAKISEPVLAHLMSAQLELGRALLVVNSGTGLGEAEDTMEERETHAVIHVQEAMACIERATASSKFLDGRRDVAFVCRLLPTSVAPLFAVFRMCAEIFETFGWGRRKSETKLVAGKFAKLAAEFSVFVKAMQAAFSSENLPEDRSAFNGVVPDCIDETILAHTEARVATGRQESHLRVSPHLENMSTYLDAFESAGDS